MGSHPLNLLFRFALELGALGGLGALGWTAPPPWRWLAVVLLPVMGAVIWGVFNVPGDPSRSGAAPIAVAGGMRLAIELTLLFGGAAALGYASSRWVGLGFAACIVLHYSLSLDRIAWLLQR